MADYMGLGLSEVLPECHLDGEMKSRAPHGICLTDHVGRG